jgi:excisionase family DNA binding protein
MTDPPQTLCQYRLSAICNLVDTYAIHNVPMTRLDELLSPQDLADYLDVPLNTVYRWRHRGGGPAAFRVGKHIRYRRNDVEEWIEVQLQDSHRGRG